MTRRRLEVLVLAFGAVFVAVVLFSFRPGRRPGSGSSRESLPRVPPAEEAGQPTTVLKGFDYTETVAGKALFRIQSERTVGFGAAAGLVPNVYALEKVSLTVYPAQGSPLTVHADRAQYDRRTNEAQLAGNVRWLDEKGALAESERVEFQPSARRLVAPAAVHFSRGTFDVHARSASYDVGRHELALAGPVRGSGTGEGSGGLSELAADAASYRRDEGIIELVGSVSGASREKDRISCDRMVLKAAEPEARSFEWARAEGNVRGVIAAAHQAAGGGQPGERQYAADQGSLLFAADGSIKSLALTGRPASVAERDRRVFAATIDIAFEKGRPASARAEGAVRIESGDRRAESDRASLAFSPSGEVETLELSGNVRTQAEGKSARAEKAVQLPARSVWILTGEGAGSATVESGGSRISASSIEIEEKTRGLRAEGNARAVFTREKDRGKAPTMVGDPSRPTFGKAQRIVLDDAARVATLSGGAMLWQDASSLSGDDMTLNDAERTLVAVGHSRTVFAGKSEATSGETDRRPSVVTARRVIYRENTGTALFEGNVTVTRGPWHASAESATAYLDRENRIERVEMARDVRLADSSTGRSAGAARALDWPKQDRTILEGSPAWVTDAEGNRVAGAALTITDRGRSVEVTAPEGGKTETIHKTRKGD